MRSVGLGLLAAMALATAAGARGHPGAPTDVRPIPLKPGANTVPAFTADGRTATIFQAWRENGEAHGYNLYLVSLPDPAGAPVSLVGVEDPSRGPLHEVIRDEPFDGERVTAAVRFARARIGGRAQTVLITAALDPPKDGALADHARATVSVYRLARSDLPGWTPDYFTLAWRTRTRGRFCNAELALARTLRLPLDPDYAGLNRRDGCP